MSIGFLDRRVVIEQNTAAETDVDGAGQPVENWTALATVWMRIKPARGNERFTARQVIGTAVTTFITRHRTDLTVNKHRLIFDGKTWDVHDIREVGRKQGLEIDASARSEG